MDAFQFRRLSSAPDVGDQIAVYAAGTQNLISDLVDLYGQPLVNPFVVGDADHWGFRPGVSSIVDVWWVDGGVYLARGELMDSAAEIVAAHESFVQHGTTAQEQTSIVASEMHADSLHAPAGAEANPDAGSQAQAEDNTGATVYGWTGQRLYQAVVKWASLAASIFKGKLEGYAETPTTVTFTAGAATVAVDTCNNALPMTLTQNSAVTLTGTALTGKSITLLVLHSGGAWTLSWGGTALGLVGTSGQREMVSLYYNGTNWLGYRAGVVHITA